MEWYNTLDPMMKIFWAIAIVSSLIFVAQTIMTLLGTDASDGLDADFNGDLDSGGDAHGPFQFFSFRNLVGFLLGYGWGGVCFASTIESPMWLNIVAILVGLTFVGLFFVAMLQIKKLAKDNTFKMTETVGRAADVYLGIPAERKGKGKIQISVRGAYHEIDAMTSDPDKIPTGAKVKVTGLIDSQTVSVTNKF